MSFRLICFQPITNTIPVIRIIIKIDLIIIIINKIDQKVIMRSNFFHENFKAHLIKILLVHRQKIYNKIKSKRRTPLRINPSVVTVLKKAIQKIIVTV